jgi:MYND finger
MDPDPIVDNINARNWQAYYSVVVPSAVSEAIRDRSELLVRSSESFFEWHRSKYGQILRITDPESLAKIREYWVKYAGVTEQPLNKQNQMRDEFMREFRQIQNRVNYISVSGFRSVGATCLDAGAAIIESFQRFWDTGVIGSLPELTKDATFLNPLFVYSKIGGKRCTVHYGTEPVLGFHCSSAFVDIQNDLKPYKESVVLKEKVHRLARTAIAEFKDWCIAFHSVAQDPTLLSVHNFCGDALEFCYALQTALGIFPSEENLFRACAAPWRIPVNLQPDSEFVHLYFDAIDTSNVADHIGLLNVLICALPLLKSSPSATCYTENLVDAICEESPLERLQTLLCGDPATVFCLLRAAPVECLTGVTSASSLHEEINGAMAMRQNRWRFSWKDILVGDAHVQEISESQVVPSWDVYGMSQAIMSIFSGMFQDEEIGSMLEKVRTNRKIYHRVQHYSRASFVAFIKFLQSRHRVIWLELFRQLVDLVSVRAPMSTKDSSVQELFLQLHVQRVYTTDILQKDKESVSIQFPSSWPAAFLNSSMPPILPLLFRVPRTKCEPVMKEFSPLTAEADVIFEIHISSPPYLNRYSAVQLVFADQIRKETSGIPSLWKNSNDLLVYVHIPTWTTVMFSQTSTEISLRLKNDIHAVHKFIRVLGLELIIFKTSIWNTEYVIPVYTEKFSPISCGVAKSNEETSGQGFAGSIAKISFAHNRLEATARIPLTGEHKNDLAKIGTLVDSFQNSPCTFGINVGNFRAETIMPFPFDRNLSRIRIARKSGWVEVIVPLIMNPTDPFFNFPTFPILKENPQNHYSWNLPRLSTNLLPWLNLDTKNGLNWINTNLSGSCSIRQRTIAEKHLKGITTGDALVDLKMNILRLFRVSLGTARPPNRESNSSPRVFFLDVEGSGIMSIIFVLGLRLEQYDNTVVVDSCVLPLVPELVETFPRQLDVLRRERGVDGLRCTVNEYKLWTGYVRASVERSRAWNHRSNCDGKLQGGLIYDIQQYPCRCGAGKMIGEFTSVVQWKPFTPFVTRCLFTPLFPVQGLEQSIGVDHVAQTIAAKSDDKMECWTCKSSKTPTGTKLLSCMGCSKAMYCSKECQKKDWKNHKRTCRS